MASKFAIPVDSLFIGGTQKRTLQAGAGPTLPRPLFFQNDQSPGHQGLIIIEDKGALDCVIRARLQSALLRAADEQAINWGALK